VHKTGVHLLSFSKNDTFLVTCGLNNPSAIVIYDWQNNLVLVSSSIKSPTQDIFSLPELYMDDEGGPQAPDETKGGM
jgi:hypothetical protein